jgi:hypothetical protein
MMMVESRKESPNPWFSRPDGIQLPPAQAWDKERLDCLGAVGLFHSQLGAPSSFCDQEQRVDMWVDADFVSRQLVRPPAGVLGLCRGQPFGCLHSGVLAGAAAGPGRQFLFVMVEVVVNPFQLASQAVFLARPHAVQFFAQFAL